MSKAPSLVLSSGGLHSLVAAGLASRDTRIALLHINDGRTPANKAAAAFANPPDAPSQYPHRPLRGAQQAASVRRPADIRQPAVRPL